MALPALVVVLAVALAAVDLGVSQVRCVDAARSGARALARGDARATALSEASSAAPAGSSLTATTAGDRVTVVVVAPVPGLLVPLGVGRPRAVAVARLEAPG